MSQSNREGKRAARERLAAERARQQQRQARRRRLGVLGIVLAVIVAGVGVGLGVALSKSKPTVFATPQGAVVDSYVNAKTHTNKATALPYGPASAPVTMTVFEDFRCPVCDKLETSAASAYKTYVAQGKLRVLFHVVKLIDENDIASGNNATGSVEAGNAAACAQAAGKFDAYHDVLYANQPDETTDPWASTTPLINLAKKVPGLDTPAFEQCVKSGRYKGLVDQNWSDFNTLKLSGTPTIWLNGTNLPESDFMTSQGNGNPVALSKAIQAAIVKAGGTASSPAAASSPSPSSGSPSATPPKNSSPTPSR